MNPHFHKLILMVGRIFSFIPWKLSRKRRIYQIIYTLSILTIISVDIYFCKLNDIYWVIDSILGFSLLFTVIVSAIINDSVWKKWFLLNAVTERQFRTKRNVSLNVNFKSIYLLICVIIFILAIEVFGSFKEDYGTTYMVPLSLMKFFGSYLPVIFSNIIRVKFVLLKKSMKDLYLRNKLGIISSVRIDRNKVLLYKKLYKNLFNMSNCFNKMFGWIIVIALGDFICFVCLVLHYMVNLKLQESMDARSLIYFCSFCIIEVVSTFIYKSNIVEPCMKIQISNL